MKRLPFIILIALLLLPMITNAADLGGIPALTVTNNSGGGTSYSLSIKIILAMTLLTLLPALLMTMTSFTRIIIVLSILRQAMGLQNVPNNQVLIGLSLFLSLFVMSPVLKKVNDEALQPYINKNISEQVALDRAVKPFKTFMIKQTREKDLILFQKLSGNKPLNSLDDVSLVVLMPAFVTSELKTAFQIGFLLFLPFLIIDMVVASVLMSMGMMMLSPLIVSLPFKIMLFVLIDGWLLVIGTLTSSFNL